MAKLGEVYYIRNWYDNDSQINAIRGDVFYRVTDGMYFHRRLQLTIVVLDELNPEIAKRLPQ